MTGIYQITNTLNGKHYIGSSIDVNYRYKTHLSNLRNNKHSNSKFQNAVNKYGLDKFQFQILEECNSDELLILEQLYIDRADKEMLYNLTYIAGAGGYDTLNNPVLLLSLKGKIIGEFISQMDAARYLGLPNLSKGINTKKVFYKKYRIVTPSFYESNLELILSWTKKSKGILLEVEIGKLKGIKKFKRIDFGLTIECI